MKLKPMFDGTTKVVEVYGGGYEMTLYAASEVDLRNQLLRKILFPFEYSISDENATLKVDLYVKITLT